MRALPHALYWLQTLRAAPQPELENDGVTFHYRSLQVCWLTPLWKFIKCRSLACPLRHRPDKGQFFCCALARRK